ncbi:MAG TPA: hypothetical protein VD886_07995 [Herpetosiphonaceae bacterium]|nr:hypothetical protein [Herpetosiphonaceae bacterium]
MSNTQTILLTLAVIVEVPATTPDEAEEHTWHIHDTITTAINQAIGPHARHLGWNSTRFEYLDDPVRASNSGRCAACGMWTTDCERPDRVIGLTPGARVDERLLCDDCLPPEHPWAF